MKILVVIMTCISLILTVIWTFIKNKVPGIFVKKFIKLRFNSIKSKMNIALKDYLEKNKIANYSENSTKKQKPYKELQISYDNFLNRCDFLNIENINELLEKNPKNIFPIGQEKYASIESLNISKHTLHNVIIDNKLEFTSEIRILNTKAEKISNNIWNKVEKIRKINVPPEDLKNILLEIRQLINDFKRNTKELLKLIDPYNLNKQ